MRTLPTGWRAMRRELRPRDRLLRHGPTAVTDAAFMSSRDGVTFKRWDEAFIRPGLEVRYIVVEKVDDVVPTIQSAIAKGAGSNAASASKEATPLWSPS